MPRCRSSGALSILSKSVTSVFVPASASTFVIAAVSVVLPWSIWPIVPMLTCGFVRSNFCLAILSPPSGLLAPDLGHDLFRDAVGHLLIRVELHRVCRAYLRLRSQIGRVAE